MAAVEYTLPDQRVAPVALDIAVTCAVVLPLAFRRVAPVGVLVVSCVGFAVPELVAPHDTSVFTMQLPLTVAFYTVVRHRRAGTAFAAVGIVAVTFALFAAFADADARTDPRLPPLEIGGLFFVVVEFGAALLAGAYLRRVALQRGELAAATERLRLDQERTQRLVVLRERERLTTELHDIVASAVVVMGAQCDLALRLSDRDPRLAAAAVQEIEAAGRAATAELRLMLGLLRAPGVRDEPTTPADLTAIQGLVSRMTHAGLRVSLDISGSSHDLAPGLQVTVFRIVQEALTNPLQHAGSVKVDISIRLDDPIEVEVRNGLPPEANRPHLDDGHGLTGMRRRASLHGGDLRALSVGDDFVVLATLPRASR